MKKLSAFIKDKEILSTPEAMAEYLNKAELTLEDMAHDNKELQALHIYYFGETPRVSMGNYIQQYDGLYTVYTENGHCQSDHLSDCEKYLFSYLKSQEGQ